MKRILLKLANGLMAEGILRQLRESGEFKAFLSLSEDNDGVMRDVMSFRPELILLECSYNPAFQPEVQLSLCKRINQKLPDSRVAFLCDEKSSPNIARTVVKLKKDGEIDGFFYTSVTGSYLRDALSTL